MLLLTQYVGPASSPVFLAHQIQAKTHQARITDILPDFEIVVIASVCPEFCF